MSRDETADFREFLKFADAVTSFEACMAIGRDRIFGLDEGEPELIFMTCRPDPAVECGSGRNSKRSGAGRRYGEPKTLSGTSGFQRDDDADPLWRDDRSADA
jgi:hypothetical protein